MSRYQLGKDNHSLAFLVGIDRYKHIDGYAFGTKGLKELGEALARLGFDVVERTNDQFSRPSVVEEELSKLDPRKYKQAVVYFSSWYVLSPNNQLHLIHPHSIPGRLRTTIPVSDFTARIVKTINMPVLFVLNGAENSSFRAQINVVKSSVYSDLAEIWLIRNSLSDAEQWKQTGLPFFLGRIIEVLTHGKNFIEHYTSENMLNSLRTFRGIFQVSSAIEVVSRSSLGNILFWDDGEILNFPVDILKDLDSEVKGDREDSIQELAHFFFNRSSQKLVLKAQEFLVSRFRVESDRKVRSLISSILRGDQRYQLTPKSPSYLLIKVDASNVPVIDTILVPGGAFLMGNDDPRYPAENPLHSVELDTYRIGRTPVTNAQFLCFLRDTDYDFPLDKSSLPDRLLDHPVNYVSWYDSLHFCNWLTTAYRSLGIIKSYEIITLPTEAEWEKAARGTDDRVYPWGSEFRSDCCNYKGSGWDSTTPVGFYSPQGDSPYGCVDMAGNVHEWTISLWGRGYRTPRFKYPYDPEDGREDLTTGSIVRRVVRGGAFYYIPECLRCSTRNYKYPGLRQVGSGFRFVIKRIAEINIR